MMTTRITPDTRTARHVLIVMTDEQMWRRYHGLVHPIGGPNSPIRWDDLRPEALMWALAHGYDHDHTVNESDRLEVYVADGTDLGDRYTDEARYGAYQPYPFLFVQVQRPYADRMTFQVEVAGPPADDYDHGDRVIWQAVAPPETCSRVPFRGVPAQVAEYVAWDYASDQGTCGGVAGSRVRATVAWTESGEVLATSGIHTVEPVDH